MSQLVKIEILTDLSLPYARMTLNRPEKLNAFSIEMLNHLEHTLRDLHSQARDNKIHALLMMSSSPKAFGVGADLSERLAMSVDQVGQVLDQQRRVMDALSSLPVPTLAILQGVAFGGGLELALASDLRVAAPKVELGLTETRLAIIPGAGGTQRLTRLVGPSRALELIYAGQKISATRALELGCLNAVSDNPEAWAKAWLTDVLKAGPLALRAAKEAVWGGQAQALPAALDHERRCYERVLNSIDRMEGLRAFVEKRPALYKGQ